MTATQTLSAREVLTTDDRTLVLWWGSADGAGIMECGNAPAIEVLREFLAQCADDTEREEMLDGAFTTSPDVDTIREMRAEACLAGDGEMVDICDRALEGSFEALDAVADAINAAAAMAD